jgi:uncharacterized protein DUF1638
MAIDSGTRTLVIACGALAREIVALKRLNNWEALDVECLPPELHNRPDQIASAVREAIAHARPRYQRIFVGYADCGTGGQLDAVLAAEGIGRIPGAHCYEFYANARAFAALHEAEPGTFYLTDFLVRHFERLVIEGLGLDRHPELLAEYFRNYRKVVYLAQLDDAALAAAAQAAAARLNLAFERRLTGYGELATSLAAVVGVPVASIARNKEAVSWPR